MKFNDLTWLHNIALTIIAILLIPIINLNNKYMLGIVITIFLMFLIDALVTIKDYINIKQEEKYIKSFYANINEFYDEMHNYFSKFKGYPDDNDFDIAVLIYQALKDHTDIVEFGYEIHITKGSVKNYPHPRYWITVFAPSDINHLYPFIIDCNSLRNEANRSIDFKKVLKIYRPKIISKFDKDFKKYKIYTFYEFEDGTFSRTCIENKRFVYYTQIRENQLSITDKKVIDNIIKNKISNKIYERLVDGVNQPHGKNN